MSRRPSWLILIVAAFPLIGTSDARAQARLVGLVRDSAGAPVAGAEISVADMTRTTTTGSKGEFQLAGIRPGLITVTARRLGFAPVSATLRVKDGDNTLPDFVLTPTPRELDPVAIQEQELWRERPLLREFEENRKLGLGQFVTRAELAKMQGGFISQAFGGMRGLVVVRGGSTAHTWLANPRGIESGCVTLQDRLQNENVTPRGADCGYCFPEVYLDYTRISQNGVAVNVSQFSPDQLQAIEFYSSGSAAPPRYNASITGCGLIVLHSRAVDPATRRVGRSVFDHPTRSRVFASASLSLAKSSGNGCLDCTRGSAKDVMLGYTFRDRWVVGGRYSGSTATEGGEQNIIVRHAILEWYPNPDPGRVKWFINAGAGSTSVSIHTRHATTYTDEYNANGLPSIAAGTGVDISLYRGLVLTPFVSRSRTIGGGTEGTRCVNGVNAAGTPVQSCQTLSSQPLVYQVTQLGTRIGWR